MASSILEKIGIKKGEKTEQEKRLKELWNRDWQDRELLSLLAIVKEENGEITFEKLLKKLNVPKLSTGKSYRQHDLRELIGKLLGMYTTKSPLIALDLPRAIKIRLTSAGEEFLMDTADIDFQPLFQAKQQWDYCESDRPIKKEKFKKLENMYIKKYGQKKLEEMKGKYLTKKQIQMWEMRWEGKIGD